jgi:pimeloyl-ACP methyl ester carboxylesterase
MRRWWRVFGSSIASLACLAVVVAVVIAVVLASPAAATRAAVPQSIGYHVALQPGGQPPVKIYVEEMGRGPPILFLHGLGGSSYSWRFVAPRLAATHRVIAIDLRGFGRSDKPFDRAYSAADHAAVVRAFIKAANLTRVTLVGHSYGGMVALRLALDRRLEPQRIARLVLMSTPAFPQAFSTGVSFLRKPVLPYLALLLVPPELTASLALMMEKFGFDRVTDKDISIYADPLSAPGGPHALIETALQIIPDDLPHLIARYPTLTKPTLALWCRDDQVVPLSTGQKLQRTIPGARLAVVEGCDHMPAEQAPGAVVAEIRRFLAR